MNDKDFIINVGPGGTFKRSGNYQTNPEDIDHIFQQFENQPVKNITLFFHGGLVNEESGLDTARKMAALISSAGSYPICFVWETGLLETVFSSRIQDIGKRKIFQKIIQVLSRKLSQKLGFGIMEGRGPGEMMSETEADRELMKVSPFDDYKKEVIFDRGRGTAPIEQLSGNDALLKLELEGEFRQMVLSDDEFKNAVSTSELPASDARGSSRAIFSSILVIKKIASVAFRVIKRFINSRDHDFYPTIVEETFREFFIADLGAWIWNEMKVKSTTMWKENAAGAGQPEFAGRYFLDKLMIYAKKNSALQVNLTGHSAGSIAICNLLHQSFAAYPGFAYNHIIFMAPACRIDLFCEEIANHPDRYADFRSFTMSDENERKDILVPYIYTHSLLYLISGILEDEGKSFDAYILGLERHVNGAFPYNEDSILKTGNTYLYAANQNKLILSKTKEDAIDGLRTWALKHGNFDDDETTLNSIKYIISQ